MGTLFTALGAAAALSVTDIIPVHQGGARALGLTGAQLLTYVGGSYVAKAGGTMTGALTLPAGVLGTPSLMFDGAGATTGLYSTGANDISFAVNGSRRAYFSTSAFTSLGTIVGSGGLTVTNGNCGVVSAGGGITWGTSGSADTYIYRDAAATLAQRNGANPQTLRIYGTADGTPGSNYQRLVLSANGTTGVTIAAEGLGTPGANQNITLQSAGTGLIKFFLNGAQRAYIDTDGYYTGIGIAGTGGKFILSDSLDLRMDPTLGVKWTASGGYSGTVDSGLMRGAAGQVDVTNGTAATYRDLKLRNLLNTEYHEMTEMTAPAAGAANTARIFAVDNGSGKTKLMVQFATGAAQQLAIEP